MSTTLYNLAAMTVASTGTGTITLGAAATINGVLFLSFAAAGVPDGATVYYSINDRGASEIGVGTYTAAGTTLTRTVINSTNANAAINMTSAAIVRITPPTSQFRDHLTATRTYFVRTDGSNSNTGLVNSAGGAFLTLQFAYDYICSNLDLAGNSIVIQGGNTPAFTSGISITQPWTGGGSIVVDLSSGSINPTNNNCITTSVPLPGTFTIQTGTLRTTTTGTCISHGSVGTIVVGTGITFGSVAASNYHISAVVPGALIQANSAYTINGGAAAHLLALGGAQVQSAGVTVTIGASITFGTCFAQATRLGFINANGNTYSLGAFTVTGTRFIADANAVIFTNGGGANYFPGTVAGGTATGGQYT